MDMKTIYTKILAAALAVLPFTSCVKEKIEPGEPENDSYGVYFETLTSAQKSVELDPADEAAFTFKAYRTKEDDDIVVPVTVTATCGGEVVEDVFSASEILFDDGQTETEFKVSFLDAEVGKTYSCTVECTSGDYVKIYSSNPTALSFQVVRAKWNELGPVSYIDEYFSYKVTEDGAKAPLLYQSDSNPYLFRMENPFTKLNSKYQGDTWFKFEILQPGQTYEFYSEVKVVSSDLVYWDPFDTGIPNTSYNKLLNYIHPADFKDTAEDEDAWAYSRVIQYQEAKDGKPALPAGVQIAPIVYMYGLGGWNYSTEPLVTIIFPGAVLTDYTLDVTADYTTQDGKLPVQFTLGTDVKKVVYDVYEGEISSLDLYTKVLEVVKNPDAAVVTESGTVELELEETGVYTIVAAAVTEGDTPEVLNYVSEVATYVAPDDAEDKAVVLTVGIELTSSYAGAGHDKTNSALGYIYGEDLTDVRWGVFKTADIDDKTVGKVKSIGDAAVEKANNGGYSYLFTKLAALTDYTLVVWATNGYSETVKTARITTDGLANVLIGKGTYTYDTGFRVDEEDKDKAYVDEGLEIFRNPNVADTYVIEHWCNNVDFSFTYDNATGKAHVATQETGYTYGGYPIYVVEYEDLLKLAGKSDEDIAKNTMVSIYDEASHTFYFAVGYILIIDGSYYANFGIGYEPYVTDEAYPDFTPTAADTPATTASFSSLIPFGTSGNLDAARIVKSGAHFGGVEVDEKVNRTVGFTAVKSDRKIEKPFLRLELAK